MILRKTQLSKREDDLSPIQGAAAISLAARLSRHSWSLAGLAVPTYSRSQVPIRFVRRIPE